MSPPGTASSDPAGAAGRPSEQAFDLAVFDRYLQRFYRNLKEDLGQTDGQMRRTLFQYGRTKGIVHDLIATNLARGLAWRRSSR